MAMGRRFGPATTFLTMAVDDVNHPNAIRSTFRSFDNNSFPATVDDDFFDKLKQGSKFRGTGDIKFDMSWPGLACRTTENPVAVASAYKKIIDSTLSVLVGLK